ncbi:hypothetical protein BU25DRAFT_184724 [Macroventuria anomochaeta]|uniref:Uncharacterized protein n=1 Tax=Macroventuria anomochaeta TaxID=301207 RepID=A0ACB6SAL5_9PLEO|nr:uncharacterized protein BU25DRAFT_184724 [Macroventuria anomochaeta]KAF2631341.1 hypothetical protein BU25DRAFT_184724 [Macroventuria anomochaeta]
MRSTLYPLQSFSYNLARSINTAVPWLLSSRCVVLFVQCCFASCSWIVTACSGHDSFILSAVQRVPHSAQLSSQPSTSARSRRYTATWRISQRSLVYLKRHLLMLLQKEDAAEFNIQMHQICMERSIY